MEKEELAHKMYIAYANSVDNKNFRKQPMPTWNELPDRQKNAWIAAAGYAIHILQTKF